MKAILQHKEVSPTPIRELKGHTGSFVFKLIDGYSFTVKFLPDQRIVATVSQDNKLKLWDIQSGTNIQTLEITNINIGIVMIKVGGAAT